MRTARRLICFVLLRLARVAWAGNLGSYFAGGGGLADRCPVAPCDVSRCGPYGWHLRGCGGKSPGECVPCANGVGAREGVVYLNNSGSVGSVTACNWGCASRYTMENGGCVPWTDAPAPGEDTGGYAVSLSLGVPLSLSAFGAPEVRGRFREAVARSFQAHADNVSIVSVSSGRPARRLLATSVLVVNATVLADGLASAFAAVDGYNATVLVVQMVQSNFHNVFLLEQPRVVMASDGDTEVTRTVPGEVVASVVGAAFFLMILGVLVVCGSPECLDQPPPATHAAWGYAPLDPYRVRAPAVRMPCMAQASWCHTA